MTTMNKSLIEKVSALKDSIERKRIRRLSRGSVRAQNGFYNSEKKWKLLKETQSDRLARISKAYYPEKYA